jgi:hypothetical protein
MISFSQLGNMGRLGNQLFQYAFLRSTACKLRVKFWCPTWQGDKIFDLNDHEVRHGDKPQLSTSYNPEPECGWLPAWEPRDGVDYAGYFTSHRFLLERETVRQWYRFANIVTDVALSKYRSIDFNNSIALHVRLGDYSTATNFYCPRIAYYQNAIRTLDPHSRMTILVFSDEPQKAEYFLRRIKRQIVIIRDNTAAVDLYLMSLCAGIVVAASTFSWWGAYLGAGRVACPVEGLLRPGATLISRDPWPEEWIQIKGGYRFYDHASFAKFSQQSRNFAGKIKRAILTNYLGHQRIH